MKLRVLLLLFVIMPFAAAETNGTINASGNPVKNITVVTGLFGYTVRYCDTNAECFGMKCFVDFDGEADDLDTSQPSGWCNATSITSCYNDGAATATGSSLCLSNTTYRSCTTGNWSVALSCPAGQTCSSGTCSTPSSSSSSSGGGGGGSSSTPSYVVSVTEVPAAFSFVQGTSAAFNITVKNTGNNTLINLTLSLTGVPADWYNVTSGKIGVLSKGNSKSFSVSLSLPETAEVKSYEVTASVSSKEGASATSSFTFSALPSQSSTIVIDETYINYTKEFRLLNSTLKDLAARNAVDEEIEAIASILTNANKKLSQADAAIERNDYFTAKQLLDEARGLLDAAKQQMERINFEGVADIIIYIAAGIFIIAVIVVAYLFWPERKEKRILKALEEKRE